jgi:hypothetical protein
VLLGAVLLLRWAIGLKGKSVAYVTIVAVFLILFAMLGVGLFCGTGHVFSSLEFEPGPLKNRVYPNARVVFVPKTTTIARVS